MTASRVISRIPGEGLNVIPAVGDGIVFDDTSVKPVGAAAVMPITFVPSWTGTKAELLAQIDDDPTVLVDDGERWAEYVTNVIRLGYPLSYSGFPYINSYHPIAAVGQKVDLRQFGDGCIVGGPDMPVGGRIVKIINTSGATARATDCHIEGLKIDLSRCPPGTLNSVNGLELSGFRKVTVRGCDIYHGEDYDNAGGDAGMFITADNVILVGNRIQGSPDLGIYVSGSFNGLLDNTSMIVTSNTFINCSNSISFKRNYRFIAVAFNYHEGCRNGVGAVDTPTDGSGLGLISGSIGTITGDVFKDMAACCIDLRRTSDWTVSNIIAGGTFGVDKDAVIVNNASIIKLDDADRCRVDFLADVTSTDASHSGIRIQNGSVDNVVSGTVKGIYSGLVEANGDRNEVELLLDAGVTSSGSIFGASTQYRWTKNGVRGFLIGPYDRLEGRMAYGSTVNTTDTVFNASTVGRVIKMQPSGSMIKALLPAGIVNGDRGGVIKWTGSGAGQVQVKDPTDSYIVAVLANVGDQMIWSFDGTTYRVESYSFNSRSMTFVETAAASIPSPPANCYTLFFDTGGALSKKDSAGTVTAI